MKKILIAALILTFASQAKALEVWRSSHTTTADTAQPLCTQVNATRRGVFHGVCVNTAVSGGSITVYNSSSTAVNAVAVLSSTATLNACKYYDVYMSTGITYTTSQANDVTFMYDCY